MALGWSSHGQLTGIFLLLLVAWTPVHWCPAHRRSTGTLFLVPALMVAMALGAPQRQGRPGKLDHVSDPEA